MHAVYDRESQFSGKQSATITETYLDEIRKLLKCFYRKHYLALQFSSKFRLLSNTTNVCLNELINFIQIIAYHFLEGVLAVVFEKWIFLMANDATVFTLIVYKKNYRCFELHNSLLRQKNMH